MQADVLHSSAGDLGMLPDTSAVLNGNRAGLSSPGPSLPLGNPVTRKPGLPMPSPTLADGFPDRRSASGLCHHTSQISSRVEWLQAKTEGASWQCSLTALLHCSAGAVCTRRPLILAVLQRCREEGSGFRVQDSGYLNPSRRCGWAWCGPGARGCSLLVWCRIVHGQGLVLKPASPAHHVSPAGWITRPWSL